MLETNIVLNVVLKRMPHYEKAKVIFDQIDQLKFSASITATTVTDIYFLAKKDLGHKNTLTMLTELVEIVKIIGVDESLIKDALISGMPDFEDAVQISSAWF